METTLKLSNVIKTNVGYMLNNWTSEHIREKYQNSINEYICKNVTRYVLLDNIYNDITYNEAVTLLYDKFSTPIHTLQKELQVQRKMKQEKWLIDEFKSSINYYKGLLQN